MPELLRAKVRVFVELHRKTRQLEALNRELEQRVMERTEELARKAELLLQLNAELVNKNQELDAIVHTAPDIIFSRQADGSVEYMSDRFYEYTGAPQNHSQFAIDYVHPEDDQRPRHDGFIVWKTAPTTKPSLIHLSRDELILTPG